MSDSLNFVVLKFLAASLFVQLLTLVKKFALIVLFIALLSVSK